MVYYLDVFICPQQFGVGQGFTIGGGVFEYASDGVTKDYVTGIPINIYIYAGAVQPGGNVSAPSNYCSTVPSAGGASAGTLVFSATGSSGQNWSACDGGVAVPSGTLADGIYTIFVSCPTSPYNCSNQKIMRNVDVPPSNAPTGTVLAKSA